MRWVVLLLFACAPAEVAVRMDAVRSMRDDEVVIERPRGSSEVRRLQVIDGMAYLYDDIELGPASRFIGAERDPQHAVLQLGNPWPCGTVLFRFETAPSKALSAAAKLRFNTAAIHIWSKTGIRFMELDGATTYPHIRVERWDKDYGTSSWIGHSGGVQTIKAPDDFSTGGFIHELGHAIGLEHEQTRSDRDDYVTYDESCVDPTKTGNFAVSPTATDVGPYDYDSIMHYSSWSFCIEDEEEECICIPLLLKPGADCELAECDPVELTIRPNRTTLSPGDIAGLMEMYEDVIPPQDAAAGDELGRAVAAGDFDGDGWVDAAIGAPGSDGSGAVELYRGRPEGLIACGPIAQGSASAQEDGDAFGQALATGDFDGDGFTDLAVGAPTEDVGAVGAAGAVTIFLGGEDGLTFDATLTEGGLGHANELGDQFGAALVAGDFDGDGDDELAIGAPFEAIGIDPEAGAVVVVKRGDDDDWDSIAVLHQELAATVNPNGDIGDEAPLPVPMSTAGSWEQFGAALAAKDLDGDGLCDLVVGAPYDEVEGNSGAGSIFLFQGRANGFAAWMRVDQRTLGADEAFDNFGSAIAIQDVDFDGYEDLIVGAPNEKVGTVLGSGWVFVFRIVADQVFDFFGMGQGAGTSELNDHFGSAIAALPDGPHLFSVGAPWERVGNNPLLTGAVFHYASAVDAANEDGFTSPVDIDLESGNDEFGAALTMYSSSWIYTLAGAPGHDGDAGKAYLFRWIAGEWEWVQTLERGKSFP